MSVRLILAAGLAAVGVARETQIKADDSEAGGGRGAPATRLSRAIHATSFLQHPHILIFVDVIYDRHGHAKDIVPSPRRAIGGRTRFGTSSFLPHPFFHLISSPLHFLSFATESLTRQSLLTQRNTYTSRSTSFKYSIGHDITAPPTRSRRAEPIFPPSRRQPEPPPRTSIPTPWHTPITRQAVLSLAFALFHYQLEVILIPANWASWERRLGAPRSYMHSKSSHITLDRSAAAASYDERLAVYPT